jgi:hypothetical protein
MRAQHGRCSGPCLGHADRCAPPQRERDWLAGWLAVVIHNISNHSPIPPLFFFFFLLQRLSCQHVTMSERLGFCAQVLGIFCLASLQDLFITLTCAKCFSNRSMDPVYGIFLISLPCPTATRWSIGKLKFSRVSIAIC